MPVKIRTNGTLLLSALLLLAAGGTAGFLLRPVEAPPDLTAAGEVGSAPVLPESYDDERTVRVHLNISSSVDLNFGTEGRVTDTECTAGGTLKSGETLARVDDEPLLGLATSVPLYRDLSSGTRGKDVRALQAELVRLGHTVEEDGVFGTQTYLAVRKLQKSLDVSSPDGAVSLEKVIWMPSSEVTVDECTAPPGSDVSPGTTFAEVPGALESARPTSVPDDLVEGERLLTVSGVTGPLDEEGLADDPEFLRELSDTTVVQNARAGEDEPVSGTVRLAEDIDVFRVPPGALFDESGGSGCLESQGSVFPVRIIGSSLGSAAVLPEEDVELPDRVDLAPNRGSTTCEEAA